MKVSVFGAGYVGLVNSLCFAQMGNEVMCVDTNVNRITQLQQGVSPLYEIGLPELLEKNIRTNKIHFTTSAQEAISYAEVIFITVGTPMTDNGSANLEYIWTVAKEIGQYINDYCVVVNKSTAPVGTADKIQAIIAAELSNRNVAIKFDVVANPEFLREGTAIYDCMHPDRIIVGTNSNDAILMMKELYAGFNQGHDNFQVMDIHSAELTKYAANAMLATKISFMNELSHIAEGVGADIEQVRRGIGADPRIGKSFLYAGCGYGGSCLPKDVKVLTKMALEIGYSPRLLTAVDHINEDQKKVLFSKILRHFNNHLQGKKIALWGLAFKPNTDDIREAPSLILIDQLLQAGASVCAYDPIATDAVKNHYKNQPNLVFMPSAMAALKESDALVVVTEWVEFKNPDFTIIKKTLNQAVIFDGRNLYNPELLLKLGFSYYGVGR